VVGLVGLGLGAAIRHTAGAVVALFGLVFLLLQLLSGLVCSALRFDGFDTVTADNASSALAAVAETEPILIVLDVNLPVLDGRQVLKRLHAAGCPAPVIFLAARDAIPDRASRRHDGVDDYMTKPFSIEKLLPGSTPCSPDPHRQSAQTVGRPDLLRVADLKLDEAGRTVTRAGVPVHLTTTEFELLRYPMHNQHAVLSKPLILDLVWKYDFGGAVNIVELYIGYLRRKIDTTGPPLIHTVRGVGYMIKAPRP
jgi:two-component system OmpR family response regulator